MEEQSTLTMFDQPLNFSRATQTPGKFIVDCREVIITKNREVLITKSGHQQFANGRDVVLNRLEIRDWRLEIGDW